MYPLIRSRHPRIGSGGPPIRSRRPAHRSRGPLRAICGRRASICGPLDAVWVTPRSGVCTPKLAVSVHSIVMVDPLPRSRHPWNRSCDGSHDMTAAAQGRRAIGTGWIAASVHLADGHCRSLVGRREPMPARWIHPGMRTRWPRPVGPPGGVPVTRRRSWPMSGVLISAELGRRVRVCDRIILIGAGSQQSTFRYGLGPVPADVVA